MFSRDEISGKQTKAYKASFEYFGDHPRATYQNDRVTMNTRYHSLLKSSLQYLPKKFSVLDVGCGLGDLHQFLLESDIDHEYTGLELVSEMATFAQNKFPNANWIVGDVYDLNEEKKYDLVVASGTFNLKMEEKTGIWLEYVESSLSKMYNLASACVSFNALSAHSDYRVTDLFYFEENWALNFAQSKTRFFELSYLTPLYEFTLTMIKELSLRNKFCDSEFAKYFKHD